MSGKLVGEVLKLKLTHPEREVLMVMAECCQNEQGRGIDCGVRYIAWATEYSERQVQRIQRQLEQKHILIADAPIKGQPTSWNIHLMNGEQKAAFVSKIRRTSSDITVSPVEAEVVTSHGKDEKAGGDIQASPQEQLSGDMPSANLSRYRKEIKEEKQERARDVSDMDDVPKHDRLEICKAWADNLGAHPIGAYSDNNQRVAAEIWRAGYRATQVALFVRAKKADGWWKGKTLTLAKVAELMPEWLLDHGPDAKKFVPPEVVNAGQDQNFVGFGVNHWVREEVLAARNG